MSDPNFHTTASAGLVGRWALLALIVALLAGTLALPTGAEEQPAEEQPAEEEPADTLSDLSKRHRQWYENVALLLTEAEREIFSSLKESYQRDHFIRRFWKVRDPFPRTARNEFQEAWTARARAAREHFDSLSGDRAQMMLYIGIPSSRRHYLCSSLLPPLEVWEYAEGSDRIGGYFTLVFIGRRPQGRGPHRQWRSEDGLSRLLSTARRFGSDDRSIAQAIQSECLRGDDILAALAQTLDVSRIQASDKFLPKPNDEWVRSFAARSTDVPEGVESMSGELAISYPGRHQSRTVVQGLVAIPKNEVEAVVVGEHSSFNLLIDGEILRQGELFDHFRYRFDFPADLASEEIPLVVQRYLRPGPYELILKVEDVSSRRIYREHLQLEVPRVEPAAIRTAALTPPPATAETGTVPVRQPPRHLQALAARLDEANASLSAGDYSIKILALPDVLSVGKLRVEARTRGEGIRKVAFELNGRPVMRKRRPPFSVEVDLGQQPKFHTLRALALDENNNTLAQDEVVVNSGPHRFSVRLLEPQSGRAYETSLRARAEVEVPEGERFQKLELYMNETLVATLFQAPFEQPMLIDPTQPVSYVRAVAYLEGDSTAEDVQFVNAPDFIDEVEVQFVELFTTVTDRKGDPVEGLSRSDFSVREDNVAQNVRRFESMRDLPIRAGLVLDTSLSMLGALREVRTAAYQFFESVLTPRDRAALITFNDEPRLAVRFTNNKEVLAGGLAELDAEGETALYDTLIFSLHYFSGLKGKRAIVLLTDGEDSVSNYSYEETIDFARRTGVAVYVIGLNLPSHKSDIRIKMRRLADETGGELFLIDRASMLVKIYEKIQQELRSQYLIAYQSSSSQPEETFREVEVEVEGKGLEAKTIRGYYP